MGGRWIAEWRLEEPSCGESAQLITADSKPFLDQLYSFSLEEIFSLGSCKTDFSGSGDSAQQLTAKPSFILFLDQLVLFNGRAIFFSEKMIFWQRLILVISHILSVQPLS